MIAQHVHSRRGRGHRAQAVRRWRWIHPDHWPAVHAELARCPACLRPTGPIVIVLRFPRVREPLHPQCAQRLATGLLDDLGRLREVA
jgi:hypothetical protein